MPRTTFLRGRELVNVAGESHYQDALRAIAGEGPGAIRQDAVAHLIPEPENKHDAHAVRVEIDSARVGYLPREVAAIYAPLLAPLAARGRIAACEGLIAGNSAGEGGAAMIGVFVKLPPPTDAVFCSDVARRF